MIAIIASFLTVALVLISNIVYVISIFNGITKPSRSSFWVWAIGQILTAGSYYASGSGLGFLLSVTAGIGSLFIAFLSLRYGEGRWSLTDTICLNLSLATATFWIVTGSSQTALFLLLIIEISGAVATLIKSWDHPESEDKIAWLLIWIATVVNLFSVAGFNFELWKLTDIAYNGCYLLTNGLITAFVWRRTSSSAIL